MAVPQRVQELVERFERNRDAYHSGHYKETQVRVEFIDPLFIALGWDVHNAEGYAEAYKDVIHEDAIRVGGATKAPDYCFRIGGTRKFFVEAKKPSIDIKGDVHPAYQLRRYAWSAKLPLSILTDFEELAVYDCRIKPVKTDQASKARVMYLTYTEYADRWGEIAGIFGREAVLKGSFDEYAASTRRKRGTAEVDEAFLAEIESWRELLARNIALRNPTLTQRELNFAVQRTIDRIIFLRICEDRGIESYGRLLALQNGAQMYQRLFQLFRQADARYNAGLFYFHEEKGRPDAPDELTPNMVIDDKVLRQIIGSLYYPDSPYEFSVLPADILGQVYECFLGKVIRLTPKHRAVVEEKPEVKKAGGVYYTPTYIVQYIVEHTVGAWLEGKSLRQAGRLTVLDPACGSGSFLLGAYQHLLNWYLDRYVSDDPQRWARSKPPRLYQAHGGDWQLTTAERKRILLKHIYGVDIDPQAVEVTKLSLLLKVLEGESEQTLNTQLVLFQERALPDLAGNIKCGNSLIGPDFYDRRQMGLFGEQEIYRINAFDWETEFSDVMEKGGFETVIGNPPWGGEFSDQELDFHRRKNREIIVRMIDSFMYFVYQGCEKLKEEGFFGMILPDVVLYQKDNARLREYILREFTIRILLNLGDVFEKVTRPACIVVLKKGAGAGNLIRIADVSRLGKKEKPAAILDTNHFGHLLQPSIRTIPGALFVTERPDHYEVWRKAKSIPHDLLGDVVDEDGIQRGVSPDLKSAFIVDGQTAQQRGLEHCKLRRTLTGGRHVKRYFIEYPDLWVIYTTREDDFRSLPNIRAYIDQFRDLITCKEVKQNKHPLYALHRPRKERIFSKKRKIVGVITEDEIIVAVDESQAFPTDGCYLFGMRKEVNPRYVVGILNSRLFVFLYRLLALEKGRVLAQVKPTVLCQLPIRRIDFDDPKTAARHKRMVDLVEGIEVLCQRCAAAKTTHEKRVIERQIEATDRQIDQLVYELYELTDEEIRIVEGSAE